MTTDKKVDYKNTLCLPQTQFPMRANLNQREPEIMKRWREVDLQARIDAKEAPNGKFILHDGPPYANGHIHVGHALNKVLKDIIVRFYTMSGYRAPYIPGWDCHGLPIEQKVSSELGGKKAGMSALDIRKQCEVSARKWAATQSAEFQRLGIGGDWEHPYLTLNPQYEVGILSALKGLVSNGFVYKGLKPVYWCPVCQTALAEAEVEYDDHTSPSIYVKFPIADAAGNEELKDLQNPSVIIWTTTPWTLPANLAVSLHPDFEYVAIRVAADHKGERRHEDWIIAKELVDAFVKAVGLGEYQVIKQVSARAIEHVEMLHPVQPGKTSKIILGTHVTLEQGTGAVHTAPGHGMEDFIVCQQYGMPTVVPVDGQGRFTSEFQLMEGMNVWEANKPIIKYLDEKDILVGSAHVAHSYPHCWRCHNPIIYRATEQWFVDVDHDDLRKKALDQIDNGVKWVPSWGRDRIFNMVQSRPDWCLSRQRVWGVPIPAVVCKSCGKATLSCDVIDKFSAIVATEGTNSWFEHPVSTFLPEGFKCPECGNAEFEKEQNILDVWFDSGASHIAVLEQNKDLAWPADMYLEGSDQHRGWFQSSLLVAMGARKAPPFKTVLTHGFILDHHGVAMSKSKGNVIPPEDIIKKFGADVLRLWVSSEDYRNDVSLGNEILDRLAEAYRRIRNTMRYLLGNVSTFDPESDAVPYENLPESDRWILHELNELITNVTRAYREFEFHKVFHWVHQFCVVQLSSIYVDVLKDRVYCSGAKSDLHRAAQTTQYEIAQALIRLMAPILVFTCDEAYQFLDTGGISAHLLPFAQTRPEWNQPILGEEWAVLLAVRTDVLRALEDARQVKKAIGQSLEAKVVLVPANSTTGELLRKKEAQLAELFITSQAVVVDEVPEVTNEITRLQGDRVSVIVLPAEGCKCERCWRILPSVGGDASQPGLCDRCSDILRRYY